MQTDPCLSSLRVRSPSWRKLHLAGPAGVSKAQKSGKGILADGAACAQVQRHRGKGEPVGVGTLRARQTNAELQKYRGSMRQVVGTERPVHQDESRGFSWMQWQPLQG